MTARHAWIDASAGIAGDMLLGALIDAGADLAVVQEAVDSVIPGAVRIAAERVTRAGLRALHVDVQLINEDQPHRSWREIESLLGGMPSASAVFARLAAVEAYVHDVPVAEVHFHEVGAWDSIADVVGVCAALEDLGIATVSAGEVALGSGQVRTAHGELPVPAPAVAELARGWRVRAGGRGELATPTGLAVLRALAVTCEDLPPMTVDAIGVGAGTRDIPDRPNVTRVVIGTPSPRRPSSPGPSDSSAPALATGRPSSPGSASSPSRAPAPSAPPASPTPSASPSPFPGSVGSHGTAGSAHEVPESAAVLLEANVDDLDPRLWPGVLAGLLGAGAADAWLVPIVMKKGRPAHTLTVLCEPGRAAAMRARIFRDTSTLGVREHSLRKTALDRLFVDVELPGGGSVAVKVGHTDGIIVQVMPEFEDVAKLARGTDRPERLVLQEAIAAAAEAGLIVGTAVPTGG